MNVLAQGNLRINEDFVKFDGKEYFIDISHIKRIRKPK